jgi:hypothetical protein
MFQVKIRSAITALLVAASVAPAAYARPDQSGSDGVRNVSAQGASPATDLRSPDARNGATWAQMSQAQDLRSPDARDTTSWAEMSRVQAPRAPQVVSVGTTPSSSGFQWADAGIGAAGLLVLMSLGASAVLLLGRHRRRRGRAVATS